MTRSASTTSPRSCASARAASGSAEPYTVAAPGPIPSPAPANVHAPLEVVAIIVSITRRTGDDLQINRAHIAARNANRRLYVANATDTAAAVRLVSRAPEV